MSIRNLAQNETAVTFFGVTGTFASWTLNGTLSLVVTICTLIVVGPKAWDQLVEWHAKYWPRISRFFRIVR